MTSSLTLGIDPAKEKFTACLLSKQGAVLDRAADYPMTRCGFDRLVGRLRRVVAPTERLVVGVEASAALDDNLIHWLGQLREAFTVITLRVDGAQVKRFSGARPIRGKTDKADARRIAQFTHLYGAQLDRFEQDAEAQAMGRAVNERARLVEQSTAAKNQLQDRLVISFPEFTEVFARPCKALALAVLERIPTAAVAARKRAASLSRIQVHRRGRQVGLARAEQLIALARTSIASATSLNDAEAIRFLIAQLAGLRTRIERIEAQLKAYQDSAPEPGDASSAEVAVAPTIPEQIALLAQTRGIGLVGAATVVLRCRGLSRFTSAKALAAQLGTNPDRIQTGRSRERGRLTHRGDRRTRSTLYLLTNMMTLFDPAMAFHKWRHQHAGHKPKQAISACMNRLAKIMWTLVETRTPYDQKRQARNAARQHPELWKTFVAQTAHDKKLWKNLEDLCVISP